MSTETPKKSASEASSATSVLTWPHPSMPALGLQKEVSRAAVRPRAVRAGGADEGEIAVEGDGVAEAVPVGGVARRELQEGLEGALDDRPSSLVWQPARRKQANPARRMVRAMGFFIGPAFLCSRVHLSNYNYRIGVACQSVGYFTAQRRAKSSSWPWLRPR